jgi:thiol-disulfide isomerase/thioredoxin
MRGANAWIFNMKPTKKDASFILKTIIAALAIMAVLHALPSSEHHAQMGAEPEIDGSVPPIQPEMTPGEMTLNEPDRTVSPETVTERLNSIRASDVRPLLKDPGGKPTMLFVYASWCGYCKRLMPNVVSRLRNKEMDHLNVVFVSIDTNLQSLAQYLANAGYGQDFTPYVVKRNPANKLRDALKATGSGYIGNIPYLAFYDNQGKLLTEMSGIPRAGELFVTINELRPKEQ